MKNKPGWQQIDSGKVYKSSIAVDTYASAL